MISPWRKIFRAVTLLTACCVAHFYVFAATPAALPGDAASTFLPQAGGTLNTTNNQPVLVNGNSVKSGTTVLSGSNVETPAGVGATVQLGFAEIEIAPETQLVLDFTPDGHVKVTLTHGCVTVRVKGSAEGTIITPDGHTTSTGDSKVAQVCHVSAAAPPVVNSTAGAHGINKALLAILLIGAASAVAILVLRGHNPSPSTP